jgi:hypothetical protein
MFHPPDCGEWQYESHPKRKAVLQRVSQEIFGEIKNSTVDAIKLVLNTRSYHARLFRELTPKNQLYLAGHYRGESFRCLQARQARIAVNPLVGLAPDLVIKAMLQFAQTTSIDIKELDKYHLDTTTTPPDRLLYTVQQACDMFAKFLLIHPYANGNGHIARILLMAVLFRYHYLLRDFPIEPRPSPNADYGAAIISHQLGDATPLQKFIADRIDNISGGG